MKVVLFAAFALCAAACSSGSHDPDRPGDDGGQPGDDGGGGGSGGPDGGDGGGNDGGNDGGNGGGDGGPTLSRVTIRTGEPPALIAFRNEASTAWTIPSATSPGTYEIDVTGPYRVVVVCKDSSRLALVTAYMRTPADDRSIDRTCGPESSRPFHVTGEMQQEGEVFFGGFGRGQSQAPWMFDLPAEAGTFDFAALFGSLTTGFERFAIRRDIAITGDLALGAIDADQEHAEALVATRFTAPNLAPDEDLSAILFDQLGNTTLAANWFTHPERAWDVGLLPDSALRSTDRQLVTLMTDAFIPSTPARQRFRSIDHEVRAGGATSVVLMETLDSIAFESTRDRLVASWGALPPYDEIAVARESFSNDFSRIVLHEALLTRAFVETTGIASTALDFTDVPGFRAEWRHDPTFLQVAFVDADAVTPAGDFVGSGVSEDILLPPAGPGLAAPRMDAQRALKLAQRFRATARRGTSGRACGSTRRGIAAACVNAR